MAAGPEAPGARRGTARLFAKKTHAGSETNAPGRGIARQEYGSLVQRRAECASSYMEVLFAAPIGALLIFLLRIVDVSMALVRMIVAVRGHRGLAASIGFFEVLIWIVAVGQALQDPDPCSGDRLALVRGRGRKRRRRFDSGVKE